MSETIEGRSFARAGLLGNPSDGYHGKTLSVVVRNFSAIVKIKPAARLRILAGVEDNEEYVSIGNFSNLVDQRGFYGGIRLLKAAVKSFYEYARARELLHQTNFEISYRSDVPRNVGLAGSSAIVTASLKALAEFYEVEISAEVMASLALSAETNRLGIPAGLQDRVIQCLEGLVFMDFGLDKMTCVDGLEIGDYQQMNLDLLPDLYVAYGDDSGQPTEVLHNNLKERFQAGDREIIAAMNEFAELAEQGRQALVDGDHVSFGQFMNLNYDLRQRICHLHPHHQSMIETARSMGATAKYCGSGGAIVGTFESPEMFESLEFSLQKIGCRVLRLDSN